MTKAIKITFILGALALMIAGCSQNQNPVVDNEIPQATPGISGLISLPPGATLDSAIFSIYPYSFIGTGTHNVSVYRITAPWDEYTVTFNSFGGSYDPVAVAALPITGTGWYSVDITSLVQGWINGSYPNYGLLIEQVEPDFTAYASADFGDYSPQVEIFYTLGGMEYSVVANNSSGDNFEDVYIWPLNPDDNYGGYQWLFTGTVEGRYKQSLIQFDLEVVLQTAAIGDFVWIDENTNGIQDAGEPGLPDVTVNLYDCQGNFVASTTTDGNGYYLFDNLTPGGYHVEFIEPEGYDITMQDQGGDDAVDSDANPFTGLTTCTTLDPGETDLTWDCGMYLVPQTGCTLTIGFWKNHAGFGPQANVLSQYLPLYLGDMGGDESIAVTDSVIAHDILLRNVYGKNSNGITKLYAQLLAAKLNIAAGADDTDVAATIASADAFLADHYYTYWDDPGITKSVKNMIIGWMSDLDDYNNGDIGPGHCGD